jgi:sterol desaturase/sphingolipid hydroxylase (fatty acid hydroxylase superfamily)
MKNIFCVLAWLVASIFVSELLGYFLHRLLHSGKVGFLSRGHMLHHLVFYGPLQSQRPETEYRDATLDAVSIGNVGLEWLVPGAILLAASMVLLWYLQVTIFHQLVFVGGSLAWSFLMFSYLHDRMHIAGFWMGQNRCLKRWFVAARLAHDIHHRALNDEGFMDKNFGIGFFLFDRLFGTLSNGRPVFNQYGYAKALRRFDEVLEPWEKKEERTLMSVAPKSEPPETYRLVRASAFPACGNRRRDVER